MQHDNTHPKVWDDTTPPTTVTAHNRRCIHTCTKIASGVCIRQHGGGGMVGIEASHMTLLSMLLLLKPKPKTPTPPAVLETRRGRYDRTVPSPLLRGSLIRKRRDSQCRRHEQHTSSQLAPVPTTVCSKKRNNKHSMSMTLIYQTLRAGQLATTLGQKRPAGRDETASRRTKEVQIKTTCNKVLMACASFVDGIFP